MHLQDVQISNDIQSSNRECDSFRIIGFSSSGRRLQSIIKSMNITGTKVEPVPIYISEMHLQVNCA